MPYVPYCLFACSAGNSHHAAFVCFFCRAICRHRYLRSVLCSATYRYVCNVTRVCPRKRNYKLPAWCLDTFPSTHRYVTAEHAFSRNPNCRRRGRAFLVSDIITFIKTSKQISWYTANHYVTDNRKIPDIDRSCAKALKNGESQRNYFYWIPIL